MTVKFFSCTCLIIVFCMVQSRIVLKGDQLKVQEMNTFLNLPNVGVHAPLAYQSANVGTHGRSEVENANLAAHAPVVYQNTNLGVHAPLAYQSANAGELVPKAKNTNVVVDMHAPLAYKTANTVGVHAPLAYLSAPRNLQVVTVSSKQLSNTIQNKNYPGLVIYHNFPSSFLVGEIFQVRGRLAVPQLKGNTYVTFCFVNKANIVTKYVFQVVVSAGNSEFSINVDTRAIPEGEYFIGLYPGTKMSYNPKEVYVLKSLITNRSMRSVGPAAPEGCSLGLVNDKLVIKWKEDSSAPIKKITFSQNGKTVEYTLTNAASWFEVVNKDFVGFTNGTVTVSVVSAYSSSNGLADRTTLYSPAWTTTFVAGPHNFSSMSSSLTLTKQLPWTANVGTTVTIEGSASVAVKNELKVEECSQYSICTYKLSASDGSAIPAGTKFSKTVTLSKTGTYIIEIKDANGECLLNRPIYVGSFLPLIPDFSDLAPVMDSLTIQKMLALQPQTVDDMRMMLLNHVNEKRASWGRGQLTMQNDLNDLAQKHSNEMAVFNYLSDFNKQGLGPQDRVNKAGLKYTVRQIVASHLDLIYAHNVMCRSPYDLQTIIMENFTKIGVGVARNSQGYIYITQVFGIPLDKVPSASSGVSIVSSMNMNGIIMSDMPLSSLSCDKLESVKNEVRDWVQKKYPTAKEDPTLSGIVCKWLCMSTADTIFDYTWGTAKYQASYLSGSFWVGPYSANFTAALNQGNYLKQPDSTYTKFGVAVVQQPDGKIKVYIEYAK